MVASHSELVWSALAIATSNDSSSGQMGDGVLLAAGECLTTSVVGVSSVSISSWGICGLCIMSPNTSAGSLSAGKSGWVSVRSILNYQRNGY